jgi:glucose dehydrogenase
MKRMAWASVWLVVSGAVLAAQVPYQRLLDAAKEPGSWLTYSGDYFGHRHSALDQITAANVAALRPAWVYQVAGQGQMETSAIVADGVMYVTGPNQVVGRRHLLRCKIGLRNCLGAKNTWEPPVRRPTAVTC